MESSLGFIKQVLEPLFSQEKRPNKRNFKLLKSAFHQFHMIIFRHLILEDLLTEAEVEEGHVELHQKEVD